MRTYRQVGPAVATGMNIAVNEILRGGGGLPQHKIQYKNFCTKW